MLSALFLGVTQISVLTTIGHNAISRIILYPIRVHNCMYSAKVALVRYALNMGIKTVTMHVK